MSARPKIRWTSSQLSRIKEAVRKFNGTITRLDNKYLGAVDLPHKVDIVEEIARIRSSVDLNRRVKQLERILVKNNPKAQEILPDGRLRYIRDELNYARRYNDKHRRELYSSIDEQDFENPWDEATARSNTNSLGRSQEGYSAKDLEELWREQYSSSSIYMDNYIAAWEEYNSSSFPGHYSVIDNIHFLERTVPEILEQLLSGMFEDEIQIEYIYPDAMSIYRNIPEKTRHTNIVSFWEDMANDFR